MECGKKQRMLLELSSGHEIKLAFLIAWRKFRGGVLKQQPWMHWITLVLVLSLVMMA